MRAVEPKHAKGAILQKRPEWGAEPGPMCYLQNLCAETQRESRRCGREEACAVVPYVVCVVDSGLHTKDAQRVHQGLAI